MKRTLALLSFLSAITIAQAAIVFSNVDDRADSLTFDFDASDVALFSSGVSASLDPVLFPGGSLDFFFNDRLAWLGNTGALTIGGDVYSFVQNSGSVNFSGSYVVGASTVTWELTSVVSSRLGRDQWAGSFSGVVTSNAVPDAGASVLLLGAGLAVVGLIQRRRRA